MGADFRLLLTKLRESSGHVRGMADPAVQDLNHRVLIGGHSKIGFWPTFLPTGIRKQAMHDGMGPEFRLVLTKLRECSGDVLGMADPAVQDLNQSSDWEAL